MQSTTTNDASLYFNANWKRYQETLFHNTLYHREMLGALNQFLNNYLISRPFSFVDIGCGDSSAVAPVLIDKPIKKYLGIDAAPDVLKIAESNLEAITCEKEFICEDMRKAIADLTSPVDIIFTSYAVHHLSYQEKFYFIQHCKNKLNINGFLLMIDGVLKENQTRDGWLDSLKNRLTITQPDVPPEEIEFRMQHPRADDFPETIKTFSDISKSQQWKNFEILVEKDIFAFMVFAK